MSPDEKLPLSLLVLISLFGRKGFDYIRKDYFFFSFTVTYFLPLFFILWYDPHFFARFRTSETVVFGFSSLVSISLFERPACNLELCYQLLSDELVLKLKSVY